MPRMIVFVWLVAAACTALVFTLPRFGVPRLLSGFNPSSVVVRTGQQLEQSMVIRASGDARLAITIVGTPSAADVAVEIDRLEGASVVPIRRVTIPLTAVQRGRLTIGFPAVAAGMGAEYRIRFRPIDTDPAAEVTLQTTEGHTYREGRLWLDGRELAADLVMQVDARTAQPWRALAHILRRQTGVSGLEWLAAVAYLGSLFIIIRSASAT